MFMYKIKNKDIRIEQSMNFSLPILFCVDMYFVGFKIVETENINEVEFCNLRSF